MLTPTGSTTLDVSWTAPAWDGGSPSSQYQVNYRPPPRPVAGWDFQNAYSSTSTTLTGLDPNANTRYGHG